MTTKIMYAKKEQLKKLNAKMLACTQCFLRKNCIQVVCGTGNAEAKILFIGEAPGKKEDETGQPFIGASGKFLDEMLATIKLKRNDIFIANIIKCRPPKNRDPLPEEIAVCWPWLLAQIKIIKPKLIVTLGKHSMRAFFPELKISQAHGKITQKNIPDIGQYFFYPLYHPAVALYKRSMREVLLRDFKRIPKIIL